MHEHFNKSFDGAINRVVSWCSSAIFNLPNFILACSVFILTFLLSRIIKRWIDSLLIEIIEQKAVRSLVTNLIAVVITGLGFLLALSILNLDTVLKSLLAGAGVAGLTVGLAIQGTLANTFSGITLALKSTFNIGDFVEIASHSGTVEEIGLNFTRLRTTDNNIVVLPNKYIIDKPLKNFSLTKHNRIIINGRVSYNANLELIKQLICTTIIKKFDCAEEEVNFYYRNFGETAINYQLRFWPNGNSSLNRIETTSEAIILIKKLLEENDIDIPVSIKTILKE